MSKDLADVVQERLDALGINAFEAARRMGEGTNRFFVNDILKGKKRSIRGDKLPLLAEALEMSVGELATPGSSPPPLSPDTMLRIVGRAGEAMDGRISTIHDLWAPALPGSPADAMIVEAALQFREFSEDGSLLYFGFMSSSPSAAAIDAVSLVLVEGEETPRVVRLLRGSQPGRFDLAPLVGPKLRDVAVTWSAELIGHLSARQARAVTKRITAQVA